MLSLESAWVCSRRAWAMGESDLNCGILGLNGLGLFVDAEGKQVVVEGSGALQAPGVVGDELRQLHFQPAFGFKVLVEGPGEAIVMLEVLGGEDDGLAGE